MEASTEVDAKPRRRGRNVAGMTGLLQHAKRAAVEAGHGGAFMASQFDFSQQVTILPSSLLMLRSDGCWADHMMSLLGCEGFHGKRSWVNNISSRELMLNRALVDHHSLYTECKVHDQHGISSHSIWTCIKYTRQSLTGRL